MWWWTAKSLLRCQVSFQTDITFLSGLVPHVLLLRQTNLDGASVVSVSASVLVLDPAQCRATRQRSRAVWHSLTGLPLPQRPTALRLAWEATNTASHSL